MSALSAELGNVDISQAYIGTLTVGTSNIAQGAVTYAESYSYGDTPEGGDSVTTINDIIVPHGLGSPKVRIDVQGLARTNVDGSLRTATLSVISLSDNATLKSISKGQTGVWSAPIHWTAPHVPPANRAVTVYRIQTVCSSWTSFLGLDAYVSVLKR
jgi:hypothetical protein